jgi:DNA-directed RNA polymerase
MSDIPHTLDENEGPSLSELQEKYGADLVQRQLDLELEMRSTGITRYNDRVQKAREKDTLTRTNEGRILQDNSIERVSLAIEAFIDASRSGKAGRKALSVAFLERLPSREIAFLATQALIDRLYRPRVTLTVVAMAIAKTLENEINFRAFREKSEGLFKVMVRSLEKTSANYERKAKLMNKAAKEHWVNVERWSPRDRLGVGIKLVEIIQESTGLIEQSKIATKNGKKSLVLSPTQATIAWLDESVKSRSVMAPVLMPTIIPPKAWTSARGGGYWSDAVPPLNLVKSHNKQYLRDLSAMDMRDVYDAVNAVQDTAWRVNPDVLRAMNDVWESGIEVGNVPRGKDIPYPDRPPGIRKATPRAQMEPDELARFDGWMKEIREIRTLNTTAISHRIYFSKTLAIAGKYSDYDEIYFPHTLDFRARMYPVPTFLHPQGSDGARGLLEFANVVPLQDRAGVRALAVQGANCYGVDKVSLDDRVLWAEQNSEKIVASAADPLGDLWWSEADSPWQFLAFCFDWAGYERDGFDHLSSLYVQRDGSCNGLQHFSAMLRDPIGGRAVNLTPSPVPSDVYQEIADRVIARAHKDAADGDVNAAAWKGLITRKVVKRPVMTLPYGSKAYGFKSQILDDTVDPMGRDGPWEDAGKAAQYLATSIWDSAGEVVVAARAAMTWLQEASRILSGCNLPIHWTTPSGFVVRQEYLKNQTQQVELTFLGRRITPAINLGKKDPKLDKRKQSNGVSPNFVHSMDSSHLMLTVIDCHAKGIRSFSMIHDSYGTHAGNTSILEQSLRETFVRMYLEHDILRDLRDELTKQLPEGVELPPLPECGDLDLTGVLDSDYFFA